ncbi:hypothetical protein NPIL_654621 [Nephila pilipes]|uniref:Uncharacterized protein n=1 Tax=Nephila pilipes TaxID=299642 RepID=A0A8X6N3H4_NEPPI|nr:hypothetical protein NPIL_654621 [Nephila pilipes]
MRPGRGRLFSPCTTAHTKAQFVSTLPRGQAPVARRSIFVLFAGEVCFVIRSFYRLASRGIDCVTTLKTFSRTRWGRPHLKLGGKRGREVSKCFVIFVIHREVWGKGSVS